MKKLVLCFILIALFLSLALVGTAAAATIYVDKNAPGANPDGLSWGTAFTSVQQGLNAAVSGDEVWVAKSTYFEHITLKSGVALYGGFAGTETTRDQRDFKVNMTTLDGSGYAYPQGCVVKSTNDTSTATQIDGFTIQNGSGMGDGDGGAYGGGIYCYNSSPKITNNIILRCAIGYGLGGGIYCSVGSPTIASNTISGNSGNGSGGIGCIDSSPTIINNVISGNSADYGGGGVGCIRATATIKNNTISGNRAGEDGGGISCLNSTPTIANNIISENNANVKTIFGNYIGGGIYCRQAAPMIINNTIYGNSASAGGGIAFEYYSAPTIANNTIAFGSSGIYNCYRYSSTTTNTPTLSHNNVYGNGTSPSDDYIGLSPGPGDISAEPLFVDRANGDYHIKRSSPCINAGDDSYVQPGWVDMDGDARTQGAHVDIGADEYDLIPPVTTIGPSGTPGENGYYTSDVTVTLSATDIGSGVARTEYSFDEITWTTYTAPFLITAEGTTTVYYRSIDNAENTETTKQEVVKIDRVPPTIISIDPPDGATGVDPTKVIVVKFSEAIQIADANQITLKKGNQDIPINADISPTSADTLLITPSEQMAYGSRHKITISAGAVKDMAGNLFSPSKLFTSTFTTSNN